MQHQADIVLSARNVSKKYYTNRGRLFGKGREEDAFLAVNNVSFDLHKGEILGIIGPNGAGKSTLLKILSEIVPPSTGEIKYRGSIQSILDIGTGFHPDLSGFQNIFLNASLLGMKKKEIEGRVNEIIEFSGISDFVHEPVKNYSSGMYLRLALSIALFTNNEIILLDEVISVGDAEFKQKAVKKIREQANLGRACIIISHDLNSIVQLCDSCLLLEKGVVVYSGSAASTVEDYYGTIIKRSAVNPALPETEMCKLIAYSFDKEKHYTDEAIQFSLKYELKKSEDFRVILKLKSYTQPVLTDSLAFRPGFNPVWYTPGIYETRCVIPANLLNKGNYFIDLILGNEDQVFVEFEVPATISVLHRPWEEHKNWNTTRVVHPVRPFCDWLTQKK